MQTNSLANPSIEVAAGVIRRSDGAVLISLRKSNSHQGGLWEFPGGKIESGERAADALARELYEELGITVRQVLPLLRIKHEYPDLQVRITVLEVLDWCNEPYGREGQRIAWAALERLDDYAFPGANIPIKSALKLPSIFGDVDLNHETEASATTYVERLLRGGCRLLRLNVDSRSFSQALSEISARCLSFGARLLLAGRAAPQLAESGDGLILQPEQCRTLARLPRNDSRMLAVVCKSVSDLAHAERLKADFVEMPVPSSTHRRCSGGVPDWCQIRSISRAARRPVILRGPVAINMFGGLRRSGVHGLCLDFSHCDAATLKRDLAQANAVLVRSAIQTPR